MDIEITNKSYLDEVLYKKKFTDYESAEEALADVILDSDAEDSLTVKVDGNEVGWKITARIGE